MEPEEVRTELDRLNSEAQAIKETLRFSHFDVAASVIGGIETLLEGIKELILQADSSTLNNLESEWRQLCHALALYVEARHGVQNLKGAGSLPALDEGRGVLVRRHLELFARFSVMASALKSA